VKHPKFQPASAMPAAGVKNEGVVKKEGGGSDAPSLSTCKPSAPKRAKITDFGLANKWEDSRLIRDVLRENGALIKWLSEKQVNIINLETLGLNSTVMCMVADYHCSRTTTVRAPGIDFLKAQVRAKKGVDIFTGYVFNMVSFDLTLYATAWVGS